MPGFNIYKVEHKYRHTSTATRTLTPKRTQTQSQTHVLKHTHTLNVPNKHCHRRNVGVLNSIPYGVSFIICAVHLLYFSITNHTFVLVLLLTLLTLFTLSISKILCSNNLQIKLSLLLCVFVGVRACSCSRPESQALSPKTRLLSLAKGPAISNLSTSRVFEHTSCRFLSIVTY